MFKFPGVLPEEETEVLHLFSNVIRGYPMPQGIHVAFIGEIEFFPRAHVDCFQMQGQIDKADVQPFASIDVAFEYHQISSCKWYFLGPGDMSDSEIFRNAT